MTDGIQPVPRLIVEVRGGRAHGTKAVILAGQTRTFGRTEIADIAVPHDPEMSSVHFELSWSGAQCRLRDRKSLRGTELNGAPVLKASVPHGGWIRAGRTDFMVYVEGHGARLIVSGDEGDAELGADDEDEAAPDPSEERRLAAAKKALSELRAESAKEPLYAILDAARDPRILSILRESVESHQSLYEGTDGDVMEDVAPYLAGPMRADSPLLDNLVEAGWGRRFGLFVTSRAPFKEVRRHLRRFLMVELSAKEQKVYFRFYDPAVFNAFFGTARAAQRRELGALLDTAFTERAPSAGLARWELGDAHRG